MAVNIFDPNINHTVDRSGWTPGRWDDEPDHEVFEAHGFTCAIWRHKTTACLCGYIAVPVGHPLYGAPDQEFYDADHGINFVAKHHDVWCVGFDNSHYGQGSPHPDQDASLGHGAYENAGRVRNRLRTIAEFLAARDVAADVAAAATNLTGLPAIVRATMAKD